MFYIRLLRTADSENWSIFVLETRKMSNLDFIRSSVEMNLFINELPLTFPVPISDEEKKIS